MTLTGRTTHTQAFAEEVSPFTERLSTIITAVIQLVLCTTKQTLRQTPGAGLFGLTELVGYDLPLPPPLADVDRELPFSFSGFGFGFLLKSWTGGHGEAF